MFTPEGYLTLTLPVTSAQHIWVKVITGIVSIFAGFVVIFLAVCVATAGELNIELFKAAIYIIIESFGWMNGHFVVYMIEFIMLIVACLFSSILLFYACISIGQLSKKNRITAAIGVYFAYYFIKQILGTIFIILMQGIARTELFEEFIKLVLENSVLSIHWFLLAGTIFTVLLGMLYFAISHFILNRKLNLE